MHALTILVRILSASLPEIHTKRLTSLMAAVEAVVTGSRLTLSDMGRGLSGSAAVKHNIKRIDRLLGNTALHTEVPKLYEALVRQCLEGIYTFDRHRLVGFDSKPALANCCVLLLPSKGAA